MTFLRILQHQQPRLYQVCRARGYATATRPLAQAAQADTAKKAAGAAATEAAPLSSCPEGTVLVGANYLKGQAPVTAKADEEYPEWLWTILSPKVYPEDGPGGMAERVRRRQERKQAIKDRNFMSTQ